MRCGRGRGCGRGSRPGTDRARSAACGCRGADGPLRRLDRAGAAGPGHRPRRAVRAAGRLRLRQDDAAADAGRVHRTRRGAHHAGWAGHHRAAAAPAAGEHDVPVLRAVPAHERSGQYRLRPAPAGLPAAEIARRVAELLALVRLEPFADRRPDALSGGQRQRVALARSLAPRPELLLLDEPLSALDRGLREATRTELVRVQRQLGTTFVLVTHDQEEALSMATRIGLLEGGRLAQVGTPAEIYERPGQPQRRGVHGGGQHPAAHGCGTGRAGPADVWACRRGSTPPGCPATCTSRSGRSACAWPAGRPRPERRGGARWRRAPTAASWWTTACGSRRGGAAGQPAAGRRGRGWRCRRARRCAYRGRRTPASCCRNEALAGAGPGLGLAAAVHRAAGRDRARAVVLAGGRQRAALRSAGDLGRVVAVAASAGRQLRGPGGRTISTWMPGCRACWSRRSRPCCAC